MIGYIVRNTDNLKYVWKVEFNSHAKQVITEYKIIEIIYDKDYQEINAGTHADGSILRRLILTDERVIIKEVFGS